MTHVIVSAIEDGLEWPDFPAIRVVPQSLTLCLLIGDRGFFVLKTVTCARGVLAIVSAVSGIQSEHAACRAGLSFTRLLNQEKYTIGGRRNESFGKIK